MDFENIGKVNLAKMMRNELYAIWHEAVQA